MSGKSVAVLGNSVGVVTGAGAGAVSGWAAGAGVVFCATITGSSTGFSGSATGAGSAAATSFVISRSFTTGEGVGSSTEVRATVSVVVFVKATCRNCFGYRNS